MRKQPLKNPDFTVCLQIWFQITYVWFKRFGFMLSIVNHWFEFRPDSNSYLISLFLKLLASLLHTTFIKELKNKSIVIGHVSKTQLFMLSM